ncbi:hypothetical protein ACJ72_07902, partial [Emergomyces africanus]
MDFDNLACNKNAIIFIVWERNLEKCLRFNRTPIEATSYSHGSYNRCFIVKFNHRPDVVVRFNVLG